MKRILPLFTLIFSLFITITTYSQITYQDAFPNLTFRFAVEIQNSGVLGDDRLFVVEQEGEIEVFDNDPSTTTKTTFLDIKSIVNFNFGQELGLLGLDFHPDYAQNGYFYVYYTSSQGGIPSIIVARYSVDSVNPNLADASSGVILFEFVKNISFSNHNGGKIEFGPDGYLYASIGDGGGGNDPANNGQDINTYFGKILRIDVDVDGNNPVDNNGVLPDGNYEIPSDNPFVGVAGLDEIYAYGIRNTWKMSFDPQANILWGADVGQNAFEEINIIKNGENYGWDRFEAFSVANPSTPDPGNAVFPVLAYDQLSGDESITGGFVYHGTDITSTNPNIGGKYVFGDFASGRVWYMEYDPSTGTSSKHLLFLATDGGSAVNLSSFGLDINNEIYFSDYGSNASIFKMVDGFTPPSATVVSGVGEWCTLTSGTDGIVYSIITDNNDITYIAGDFNTAGGIASTDIAAWDGSAWAAFNGATNGRINALAMTSNGDIYAGGLFTEINGVSANNIARYDGTNWQPLANGTSGPVAAISVDSNDNVYVGGVFEEANGITANNIARWNGTWSAMVDASNSIAGTNNEIRSIEVDENDVVYCGGNFASAGGNTASRIATWDGTNWGTLGAGTSGFVEAILNTDDYIYAGGNFAIAGAVTVNRIARWNKNTMTWEKIGDGLSNNVNDIKMHNGFVYVSGAFRNALNVSPDPNIVVNRVVRWSDAVGWEAIGNTTQVGTDNVVNTIHFNNNKMITGGNFTMAGPNAVNFVACWEDTCPVALEVSSNTVDEMYEASDSVFSKNDCIVLGNAHFQAGNEVILNPGFQAPQGEEFRAVIGGCGVVVPLLTSNTPPHKSIYTNGNINLSTQNLLIYPNPASEVVFVEFWGEKVGENYTVNLLNIQGKIVSSFTQRNITKGKNQIKIPTNNLESGVYLVQVVSNGTMLTERVVVE